MNSAHYKKLITHFYYFIIAIFSFYINYWVASRGVFPIDTFVHFDSAARIIQKEIPIKDFFLQIFLFPQSIGSSRFENYNLNLNNLILEYKFIYIPLIALIFLIILSIIKKKNYLKSEDCKIFLLILFFSLSSIFHQIYTKNQTYIYFLIPLLRKF